MQVILSAKGSKQYIVKKPNNCEYKDEMQRYFSKQPLSDGHYCSGFRNKYSGKASVICSQCEFYKEGMK